MVSGLLSVVELAAAELAESADGALCADVVNLRRVIDALEGQWLRRVEAVDARGAFGVDGGLSTASWLRGFCRLSPGDAGRTVSVARGLRELPQMGAALCSGAISVSHARGIVATITPARCKAADEAGLSIVEAERVLVDAARVLDPARCRVVGARWAHAVDPLGAVQDAQSAYNARRLHLSRSFENSVVLDGQFDAEGGETILTAINAQLQASLSATDTRSPAQRRADALVDICREALDSGQLPDLGGERPHISVVVDVASLSSARGQTGSAGGQLTWGGPITAEAARRLACDAQITRIVMGPDGQPLDVGRATRSISPALRRALAVRDGGCRWTGCDRPAAWTDAHHLISWAHGGETKLSLLVLLCRPHHRYVHEGGCTLTGSNGAICIHRPDGTELAMPP